MSFILEALRKSEHERQKQTGPIVANPYAAPRRPQLPLPLGWIIGIAALLLINIVVVLALVLRKPSPEQTVEPPLPQTQAPAPAPLENPAPKLAATPPPIVETPATQNPIPVEPPPLAAVRDQPLEAPAAPPRGYVPTIGELNLQGADALPPLHLDIHVHAAKPAERFVFINSRKYREGAQTSEGLTVETITGEGVILNRNGLRFLLPRP